MKPKWQKLASLAQEKCTLWFQFFGAVFASKGYPLKNIFALQLLCLSPHGNLTKAPKGRQGHAKLIVRNKVFECLTLLKIEVIEYGKIGFKMA